MKGRGAAVIPAVVSLIILHTIAVPTTEPSSTLGLLVRCSEGRFNSFYFKGYCYEVIITPSRWNVGKEYCQHISSHLVSIHSYEEIVFLKKLLSESVTVKGNRVWIGLSAHGNDDGNHSWSDGSPLDFTNWDANEPNNHDKKEECVNMYIGHGRWNDEQCNSLMGFICQRNKDAVVFENNVTTTPDVTNATGNIPTTPDPSIGKCNRGWYPANDRCYLPVGYDEKDQEEWENAEENCHRHEGHLVSIRNEREQAFLSYLVKGLRGDVWIGFRTIQSNKYNWVDDSLRQYTNWASGQPLRSSGNQRFCVKLADYGKWRVDQCSKKLSYICYMDKGNESDESPDVGPFSGVAETYESAIKENFSDDSLNRKIMSVLVLILATVLLVLFILVGMAIVSHCQFDRTYFRNPFRHRRNRQQNTLYNVDSSTIEYQEGFTNDSR